MAVISTTDGVSISGRTLTQRRTELTVTAVSSGVGQVVLWCRDVELGATAPGVPLVVDLAVLPAGRAPIEVRWPGRKDTKWVTLVPDPKPGPGNTGVPPGTVLSPSPRLVVRTPGTVLEDLDLAGLRIEADDVVVRRCRIADGGTVVGGPGRGAQLEDCTIDGLGQSGMGVMLAHVTIRRCSIFGVNDGVRATTGVHLVDSWVHHLVRQGALHPDCVQTTGGVGARIEHCTLDAYNPDTGEMGNAAVMIGGETAPLVDFTVRDCWLDGGNGTIMVRSDAVPGPVTLTGNRFGPHHRYANLMHGSVLPTYEGVRDDGAPLKVSRL